jgi:signal peptidase I
MKIHWFLSRKVRQAYDVCDFVRKRINEQKDILKPEHRKALETAVADLKTAALDKKSNDEIQRHLDNVEKVAGNYLIPYPAAGWRENFEVLLVAIAVAMAIRTFFLQPFKIPTGSMQPTLYGVEWEPIGKYPGFFQRVFSACVRGEFYHKLEAEADGTLVSLSAPKSFFRMVNRQQITVAYEINGQTVTKDHLLWFSPDDPSRMIEAQQLRPGRRFQKGEYILNIKEVAGDHLFVDRLTYNFRRPKRGEIIVFRTKGIYDLPQDQFYIKRLVALGNERVRIGNDQHTYINNERLDASTQHFENVFTFPPEPRRNHYFGHVNGMVALRVDPRYGTLSPRFPDEKTEFVVRPNHYLVFGDNTLHSLDSRNWGDLPEENVIGKSFFVYWPISNHGNSRFGWSHR